MEITAYLRELTVGDVKTVLESITDVECKENIFYSEQVDSQNSLDGKIYRCVDHNLNIGLIRMTSYADGYMLSYWLEQTYRLSEYEKCILVLAENYLFELDQKTKLYIQVSYDNIATQVLAYRLGYSDYKCERYMIFSKLVKKQDLGFLVKKNAVLLLTNNQNALPLYKWLCEYEHDAVTIYSGEVFENSISFLDPKIVISYNYKYIIGQNVIDNMGSAIYNMHISYLPYNRGAQPNFWSFIDDTPKGVTIHRLEHGLDKGDVICQKQLEFDESLETFASTYMKLNEEIVKLIEDNWEDIRNGSIKGKKQRGKGSYHDMKAFLRYTDQNPLDWNDSILDYKNRCKKC